MAYNLGLSSRGSPQPTDGDAILNLIIGILNQKIVIKKYKNSED